MSTPSIFSAIKKLQLLLTREEKLKWLGIVGFALCTSLLEVATASIIVVFAQVLNQPESGQKYLSMVGASSNLSRGHIILYIALVVGLIYLVKNIIAAVEVFYQNFAIQNMNYHFKNKLLHRYAEANYGFYLTRNSSQGYQVIAGDVEQMFSHGAISVATILSEGTVFLCLIGLVVYMNPSLALTISCIGIVLGFSVTKGLLPKFYHWGKRLQESSLYSSQSLFQFFHAFKEIVLLGKKEAFVSAYRHHSYKKSQIHAMQSATNALPRMVIEVLFVGLFVTTVAFLCFDNESPIQMIGVLGGYLYAGFRLMPGLNRIINQLNTFKSGIPSIERIYNEYNLVSLKESYLDIQDFAFQTSISVKNVCFSYLNTSRDALKNVSFEIKKGECLGIVGETGSGKSTLVDVILGLLMPYSGSVLVDHKYPVNAYQWHQKIGYVPQSIYLTDDTIEANIAFGEQEIDAVKLNVAIDSAQLNNFIDQLPEKLKTIVGERGIRLSGGERQRIAIARALYRNPEVLIFDEATSALDNETEARLIETIQKLSQDRTVIMVAHRLTTLRHCERILIMDKGNVSRVVSYDELSVSS